MKIYIVSCFEEEGYQTYFTRAFSSREAAERAIEEDATVNSTELGKELERVWDQNFKDYIDIYYEDEDSEHSFTYRLSWCELEN